MDEEFNFDAIPFKAKYIGRHTKNGWVSNAWTVTIHNNEFPCHIGIGLKSKDGTTRVPDIKGVMRSLLRDMDAGDKTFEEFCSDYGYDEDSRKAYALWEECGRVMVRVQALFSPDEIDAMRKALEDY